jgi:preprotein translocase subunit YajC
MIRGLMNRKSLSLLAARTTTLLLTLNASAWAMARPNPDPNAPPPPAWTQWAPMIMLVAVFYFFLLRPQSKQRREREKMLGELKKGDRIVTQSGFIVTVSNVGPKILEVKLNDDTRVQMTRAGVQEVLTENAAADLTGAASSK